MPWSFCSIATRAYALGVYLCSKRRGLMPWIGTTCMIKMIELHSRVRVHCHVVKLIMMLIMMICVCCYEDDCDVDYDVICLLL